MSGSRLIPAPNTGAGSACVFLLAGVSANSNPVSTANLLLVLRETNE